MKTKNKKENIKPEIKYPEFIIPGESPDPENNIEKFIKVGWALAGMSLSTGFLMYVLKVIGFTFLPQHPNSTDYVRACAFFIACINILCWIWFPLADLWVARKWVKTRKSVFSANTSEFFCIILVPFLLVALIASTAINSFVFGLTGTAVYVWNLLGYAIVRREVIKAVNEAKNNYSKESTGDKKILLLSALDVVEKHWACARTDGIFRNRQQIRHALLAIGFIGVAILGFVSQQTAQANLELYAYVIGIFVMIAAEISIAIWRSSRDKALHDIFEELRYNNHITKS